MNPLHAALGQLFVCGFDGEETTEEIIDLVARFNLGGVILFRRNLKHPEQILALTRSLQRHAREHPLFVAIDQEGGRVVRLPEPFTHFPASRALGTSGSEHLAFEFGRATATELAAVGINFNLAPVLDLDTNPHNPVIGDRSFGADPLEVARLGLAVLQGFRQLGVIGAAKHFPGHGDTEHDSHITLPVVDHPAELLKTREVVPFARVIAHPEGPDTIMTAHVLYSSLDPELPATLSKKILTHLLRRDLGFRGLVITDDLEMKAIIDRFGPEEASYKALYAGANLLLFCHTPSYIPLCIEALTTRISRGDLIAERIKTSLDQITRIKYTYLSKDLPSDSRKQLFAKIGCQEHQLIAEKIRCYGQSNRENAAS